MASRSRKIGWAILAGASGAAVLLLAGGAVLCENALHLPKRTIPPGSFPLVSQPTLVPLRIRARDGVALSAWFAVPKAGNGGCVILLHGVADSHLSEAPLARMFLDNHYAVLMPDSRGHGESAGLVTYGLREADDVHRWAGRLAASGCPEGIFALGESLGAAILLQALTVETRFRAVVAECPFASFQRIAEERIVQRLPLPLPLGRAAAAPLVWCGFLYARMKYGLDFWKVSPATGVSRTRTPILLIHGLTDRNILPEHSRIIASRNQQTISLWLVKGAGHTGAFGTAPDEFQRRVLDWFAAHSRRAGPS